MTDSLAIATGMEYEQLKRKHDAALAALQDLKFGAEMMLQFPPSGAFGNYIREVHKVAHAALVSK